MNKRDFVKMIGLGAAGVAIPQSVSAERDEIYADSNDATVGDYIADLGDVKFKILPAGNGPAELDFGNDELVPFLSHPQPLLVMIERDLYENGVWGPSSVRWRPFNDMSLNSLLEAVGYLCLSRFSPYEYDTDYKEESNGEKLDEARIEEHEQRRKFELVNL
jgi:hypothetical protein